MNHKTYEENHFPDSSIYSRHHRLDGEWHREDGPAVIYYHKNGNLEIEGYFINGHFHREDGPAYMDYYENGEVRTETYYLNGIECDLLQEMVIRGLGMKP